MYCRLPGFYIHGIFQARVLKWVAISFPQRIEYYTVIPSQRPAIFCCPARRLWRQHCGSRQCSGEDHETGGKGAGPNSWKNNTAQGHTINRLKSNGSKMTSQIQLNLDPHLQAKCQRCQDSSRHCQKTKEWVVPQLLEWSSHSLTYEITQLGKTNHTTFHGHQCNGPYPVKCASLNPNKSTSYLWLCLSLSF